MAEPDRGVDWDQIVEEHAERVFRVAYRILGTVHDAEDASQDVFLEAVVLYRRGPVQSWIGLLTRLATLRSLDRRRRRRPVAQIRENDLISCGEPEDQVVAAELDEWLRDEVARLPDQQGAVFTLAYFERLAQADIATILDISLSSVSTSLWQARRRLSDRISIFQGEQA